VALGAPAAASAWTTLATGVQPGVVPAALVTQAGTELVSFESPVAGTISVSRNRAAAKVVVANDPVPGQTQLVQQPSGAVQLYFPYAQGIGRLTSTDDGATWTGPVPTGSRDTGGVSGAAVAPDGTPYFAQWHTGAVNIYRGLNGDSSANTYTPCCGYDVSVAVDSTGLVQLAFFSNATPSGAFVYQALGSNLAPTASTPLAPSVEHPPRVPLVSDQSGNTFMAWAPGNPTATAFTVVPFRSGQPAGDGVTFHMAFGGGEPHMALSVDPVNRLWAVFTGNGAVHAARSRSQGQHFGATVAASVPGTAYQVSAVGLPGSPGTVDVIVNSGSDLVEQAFQPGLSVQLSKKAHKVGKKIVTTWYAKALDDGFGVAGATFTVAGHAVLGDATGKAKVPAGAGRASAPGYVAASFKVP